VFGAHMTGIDWRTDGPILVKKGVVYSHCPSGGGAGGGTQPYPEALGAGVKVNIGIDTHSNDFIENVKLAVIYGQARFALIRDLMKDAAPPMKNPTIWTAIEGSTVVSTDALKRPDLGRISAGAKADLIGVNVTGPLIGTGALPPEPLNNLLYANGLSVRNVMTDGVFQIYNGRLTVDDEAKVTKAGGEAVARIWRMLEQEDWFKPTPR
jgi:cytosine/adenosine deaminase-related metal-dependent hydrolase